MDFTIATGSCTDYNRCINGQIVRFSCSFGYVFDTRIRACNLNNLVPNPCGTLAANTIPSCTSSIDFTRVPVTCDRYYRCVNDLRVEVACPLLTVFNTETRQCTSSNQVASPCGSAIGEYLFSFIFQINYHALINIKIACNSGVHLTLVPNTCNQYYVCNNGIRSIERCGTGLAFDGVSRRCLSPAEFSGTCGTAVACDPALVHLTGVIGSCNQYYACINNIRSTLTCEANLVFDRTSRTCVSADRVLAPCGTAVGNLFYTFIKYFLKAKS